ncbi:MAG: hypothetical protein AAFP91_18430, partial [Pseudomonadota bacterium]
AQALQAANGVVFGDRAAVGGQGGPEVHEGRPDLRGPGQGRLQQDLDDGRAPGDAGALGAPQAEVDLGPGDGLRGGPLPDDHLHGHQR